MKIALEQVTKIIRESELTGAEKLGMKLERAFRKNTHAIEAALGVVTTSRLAILVYSFAGGTGWDPEKRYNITVWVISFVAYLAFVLLSYGKDRMEIDIKNRKGVSVANSNSLAIYHTTYTEWIFKKAEIIDERSGEISARQFINDGAAQFGVITLEAIDQRLALMNMQIANINLSDRKSRKKFEQRTPADPVPLTKQAQSIDD